MIQTPLDPVCYSVSYQAKEKQMEDDLVYRIFVEFAVLEGKRDVNGNWLTTESTEIPRLLKKAFAVVARASAEVPPAR